MKSAMKLDIKGIKCDNCDYKNEDVKLEEYEKWLNKPCPKCGNNLLTQEDLDSVTKFKAIVDTFNEILPKPNGNEKKATFNLEMNGTGDIGFKLEEMEGENE